MSIIEVSKVYEEIEKHRGEINKLKATLSKLPKLELSSVYDEGKVYGICYEDGLGSMETLEYMDNNVGPLIEIATNKAKDFLNNRLYIVSFKPSEIVFKVGSKGENK